MIVGTIGTAERAFDNSEAFARDNGAYGGVHAWLSAGYPLWVEPPAIGSLQVSVATKAG